MASNEDDFKVIRTMELRESSDSYTIQLVRGGYLMEFPIKLTSNDVKFLCKIFAIPYSNKWVSYLLQNEKNGVQIHIPKAIHPPKKQCAPNPFGAPKKPLWYGDDTNPKP